MLSGRNFVDGRWKTFIVTVLLAILTASSFWLLVARADSLPAFLTDELANVQSATSFFSGRPYQSQQYGQIYSSGLATTWPAAIGWAVRGDMLGARLGNGFAAWVAAILLGFFFLRSLGISTAGAVATPMVLWAILTTSPFALPYWHGFLYSLGEFQGALWLGFGVYLLRREPRLAAFIMGLAVWHGKLLYFGFALGALAGHTAAEWIEKGESDSRYFRLIAKVAQYAFLFIAPLIISLADLRIRFGADTFRAFWMTQFAWVKWAGASSSHSLSTPISMTHHLATRFTSSVTEWSAYSLGTKLKILGLTFGPLGLGVLAIGSTAGRRHWRYPRWITCGLLVALAIHLAWWYLVDHWMFARYIQPAIYVGIGLSVYWIAQWIKEHPSLLSARTIWLSALVAVTILQGFVAIRTPVGSPQDSYARSCDDLYGPSCTLNQSIHSWSPDGQLPFSATGPQ